MTEKQKELTTRLLKQAELHQAALIAHLERMPADRNEHEWLERSVKLDAQIEYLTKKLEGK